MSSTKPTDSLPIVRLHKMIRGNYAAKWDEDRDLACKSALKQMLAEKGPKRTEQAVLECIKHEQFFEAATLWKHVPAAEIERKYCPRCRDSEGWLAVLVDGERTARRLKCQHHPMEPTVQVWIGPANERRQVTATCCDYVDHFQP